MTHNIESGQSNFGSVEYTISQPDGSTNPGNIWVVIKGAKEGSEFKERATLAKVFYSDCRFLAVDLGHNFLQGNTGRTFLSPQVQLALPKRQGSCDSKDLQPSFQNGIEGVDYHIEGQGYERLFHLARRPQHMRLAWNVTDSMVAVVLEHLSSGVQKTVQAPIDINPQTIMAFDPARILGNSKISLNYHGPFRGFLNAFLFELLPPRPIIRPTEVSEQVEWFLQRAHLLDLDTGSRLEEQYLNLFDQYYRDSKKRTPPMRH